MDNLINFIETAIKEGKFAEVREEVNQLNVVDIAQLLNDLDGEKALIIFRLLPKEVSVEVFSYIFSEQQQFFIESITDKEIKHILDNLFMDDTVDILEEMPANIVKKVLKNASDEQRKLINQFLQYPEDSSGSLMTIEYVDLKKEMTVKQAIERIQKIGVDKETIDICYVTDNYRKLEGIIHLRTLILNDGNVAVADIMDTNFISCDTHMDQEEVGILFRKYGLLAMPVVDQDNRLVGIITVDDIIHMIEQENTEDFQMMAAMEPSETEYLKTDVKILAKNRVVWLLVLMVSATLTGGIIKKYEDILASIVILTSYIPMLMDSGGNAGSQSSTMIIRGLALGEIQLSDLSKVIWKEFRIGITIGITMAVVNIARIYIFDGVNIWVGLTVSISLFFTIVLAKVVGGSLPMIAKKLRLDPAIMAGPMITTIVDAVALLVYFQLATVLLGL